MDSKIFVSYLRDLISEGHKWQNTDINNVTKPNVWYFSFVQYVIVAISISLAIFKPTILTGELAGYLIAGLSIIIGLFSSYNLFVFERFSGFKSEFIQAAGQKRPSNEQKNSYKQRINLFHQLTVLSSYAIMLSLVCILLMVINSGVNDVHFPSIDSASITALSFISENYFWILVTCLRIILFYFLLDIVYLITYMVSVNNKYMVIEYGKESQSKL